MPRMRLPSAADQTKAEGEMTVRAAFLVVTLVRLSLIYGLGDFFFGRFVMCYAFLTYPCSPDALVGFRRGVGTLAGALG